MTPKAARTRLSVFRPNGSDAGAPEVQRAQADLEGNPRLLEAFQTQVAFDGGIAQLLERLEPGEETGTLLRDAAMRELPARKRFLFADPAMIAVAVGFLGIVFLVVWLTMGRPDAFEGREKVIEIAQTASEARADQFEPVSATVGKMGDWFALQGFAGFRVPKGFEQYELVGVRLLPFEGTNVACMAIPEPHLFLYVFQADSLGVNPGKAGEWKVIELPNGQVVGIEEAQGVAFMVVMDGEPDDMRRLIARSGG